MKLLLLFASLACFTGFAQSLSQTCPASVKAGTTLTIPVSLVNGQSASGLQYTVTAPSNLGTLTALVAGSAVTNSKQLYQTGSVILIGGFGPPPTGGSLNSSQMSDGVVANLMWQVPASLGNQTVQISITGATIPMVATSPSGVVIPLTANPPCAVSVLPSANFCDLNGDGVVNQADVTVQRTLVTTFPQPSNCARNTNGCNVGAIQIVVNAALGGACTATQ